MSEAMIVRRGSGGGGIAPTGKIEINSNGDDIDVAQYALAKVAVPTGVFPSGKTEIYANGDNIDVSTYEKAKVAVGPYIAKGYALLHVEIPNNGFYTYVNVTAPGKTITPNANDAFLNADESGVEYNYLLGPGDVGKKYTLHYTITGYSPLESEVTVSSIDHVYELKTVQI